MLLSSTHLFVLSGSCSFHAYPFNRSVVSSFQVSSHLVKFNSFHLQVECCPNYITLIPSLSCLTGVLCLFAQVLFALSSLANLLNRSTAQSYSSLFLFANGVLSTSLLLVAFFLSICSTSQGTWFHSFVKGTRKNKFEHHSGWKDMQGLIKWRT